MSTLFSVSNDLLIHSRYLSLAKLKLHRSVHVSDLSVMVWLLWKREISRVCE